MPVQSQSPYRCSFYQLAHFELRGHDGLSTTLKHGINYSQHARRPTNTLKYTLGKKAPYKLLYNQVNLNLRHARYPQV